MLQVPAVPVWWWHSSGGLFGALAVCALAPPGESSKLGSLTGLRHRASPLVCSSLLLASEHPHSPLSPPWLLVGHITSSAVCPAVGLPGPQKQAFPPPPLIGVCSPYPKVAVPSMTTASSSSGPCLTHTGISLMLSKKLFFPKQVHSHDLTDPLHTCVGQTGQVIGFAFCR